MVENNALIIWAEYGGQGVMIEEDDDEFGDKDIAIASLERESNNFLEHVILLSYRSRC